MQIIFVGRFRFPSTYYWESWKTFPRQHLNTRVTDQLKRIKINNIRTPLMYNYTCVIDGQWVPHIRLCHCLLLFRNWKGPEHNSSLITEKVSLIEDFLFLCFRSRPDGSEATLSLVSDWTLYPRVRLVSDGLRIIIYAVVSVGLLAQTNSAGILSPTSYYYYYYFYVHILF